MAERVGKSQADLLNVAEQLIAGFSKAENDPKQAAYAKELKAARDNVRSDDEGQEKAKADLYAASNKLKDSEKELKTLVARSISFLESEYGKTGPELQGYGISRRQPTVRKKTPAAKKET